MNKFQKLNVLTASSVCALMLSGQLPAEYLINNSYAAVTITPAPTVGCTKLNDIPVKVNTTSRLNVRAGTSTSRPVVGQLNSGEVVTATHVTKAWYRIKFKRDGVTKEGWI